MAGRSARKSSNLENLGLGAKSSSHKVARAVSQTVLRDATLRRRNRVLSGIKSLKPEDAIKRQKLTQPVVRVDLPTPPASPCTPAQSFENMNIRDPRTGSIPSILERPEIRPVEPHMIAEIAPELGKIPLQFVLDSLKIIGPQLWKVVQSITVPPFNPSQTHATVKITGLTGQMPSHLLAVYKRPADGSKASPRDARLYPTHKMILYTQCGDAMYSLMHASARLPQVGDEAQVPIVAMAVPHPESFPVVHEYLYTQDRAVFAARIVPYPSPHVAGANSSHTHANWVRRLAATYSQQVLVAHLAFAAGVYANMCALDIQTFEMWHALQACWTVLRSALLVQQQAQRAQSPRA